MAEEVIEQAPAKRGYALYILVLLLLINTLSYADRHLFSILIPAIKAEFGASDALMGLIAGPGFIVAYVLFSMPMAQWADRWSRRGVLALASTLWSIATAACGAAANVATLAAARFVVGVGEAGGLPPSQSMIAGLFDERRRSGALGVLASATYFGLALGLLGGAALASTLGWRGAFVALAAPGIPLALLLWLTGPRRGAAPARTMAPPRQSMLATLRQCWRIPSLRLLAIGVGVFNIFGYAGAIWMPAYFMRSHGMSVIAAGAWLGLGAALGGIVGSLTSGWLVDRLRVRDERWQLRVPALGFVFAFPLLALMFMLPGGVAVQLGGQSVPLVAPLSLVTGFLSALWAGPSFGAAARLVPAHLRAQATAMLVVIINIIGSALGPVAAGIVSDLLTARLGEEALRYSLLSMSVLALAGGALFWRAAVRYPVDLAASSRS